MYTWNFSPPLVLGLLALAAGYWAAVGPLRSRFPGAELVSPGRQQAFWLGMLAIVVALISPVDTLGSLSLTMHMVQHMLLTLVAAPLLLVAIPGWMLRPLLRIPGMQLVGRVLTHPVPALLIYNLVFSLWHIPEAYDGALRNQSLHIAEHLSMLLTALLTWWPIYGQLEEWPRPNPPVQCIYLFFQTVPPTILGALITFATEIIYNTYQRGGVFGLSPLEDQQLGGLVMWIPGGLVFFVVLTVIFIRWLNRDEHDLEPEQSLTI